MKFNVIFSIMTDMATDQRDGMPIGPNNDQQIMKIFNYFLDQTFRITHIMLFNVGGKSSFRDLW